MATIAEYLQTAQREKASDIYFSVGTTPFLKVNGTIKPLPEQGNLSKSKIDGLAREVLSPQKWSEFKSHGEVIATCTIRDMGRLRIVFCNERKGPCMACHLIPSSVPEFESLEIPAVLKRLLSNAGGLVLVIGRARSGKTATIASLIQHINNTSEKSVVTVETPLEYVYAQNRSFIERIQPREKGMLFDKGSYSTFLSSADVMVLDGLPFDETISPALNAAAEGLLVLATLETNGGIAEVLARIIDNAPAEHRDYRRNLMAQVLRGAMWQQLFPLKDASGLTPAVEIMINDSVTSELIGQENRLHLLRPTMAAGRNKGMQTMHQALEILKRKSLVQEDIISDFENEMLKYYVSSVEVSF